MDAIRPCSSNLYNIFIFSYLLEALWGQHLYIYKGSEIDFNFRFFQIVISAWPNVRKPSSSLPLFNSRFKMGFDEKSAFFDLVSVWMNAEQMASRCSAESIERAFGFALSTVDSGYWSGRP